MIFPINFVNLKPIIYMKRLIIFLTIVLPAAIFGIVSCQKESAASSSNSTLHIRLTDAPTHFDEVNVDIREVRVKFSDDTLNTGGWVTLNTYPGIYDLLDYQNGVDTLLATGAFPLRVVKEIRFVLGPNNTIVDAGVSYPLTIPSGSESGLKINIDKSINSWNNQIGYPS